MSDPIVKLNFLGSSADAERAIAALEKRLEKLEQGIKQVSKRTKDGGLDFETVFRKMGEHVLSVAGPLEVIRNGIAVLQNEYKSLLDFQDAAKGANVDFARSLTQLALNTDAPLAQVKERISQLSKQAKMTPGDLANILNEAQAAKGHLDERQVDPTIIAASRLAKFDPESMKNIVGSSLSLQAQIPGSTAEQTIGFGLNAAAFSRVADAQQFSKNVLPAISGAFSIDKDDPKFLAALSAGITQGSGDTTGERSRNAMLGLLLQMKAAFPELKNGQERLKALQENPELAKAFLFGGEVNGKKLKGLEHEVTTEDGQVLQLSTDKASFRREMIPTMEMLTSNRESGARNAFDNAMANMPALANSDAEFRKRAAEMAADPNLKIAEQENLFAIRQRENLVENTGAAESSVMRQGLDKTMQGLGYGWAMRTSSYFQQQFDEMSGMSAKDATLNVLKDLEIRARNEEALGTLADNRKHVPGKLTSLIQELNPSEEMLAQFAQRDEAAGLAPSMGKNNPIEALKDKLDANTRAVEINTKVMAEAGQNRRPIDRNGNRE